MYCKFSFDDVFGLGDLCFDAFFIFRPQLPWFVVLRSLVVLYGRA